MSTILSVLCALLLLSVFVIIHEGGHYGAGRLLGFKILEFSVGMGPKIASFQRKGITYSWRALPIGGMCRFYGEDEDAKDGLSFNAQKVWKRMIVVLAGAFMNILFALLLSAVILMSYGDYVPAIDSYTEAGSVAEEAGVLPGDILLKVNGSRIAYFEETVPKLRAADSENSVLTIERNGSVMEIVIPNMYDAAVGHNRMGVSIVAQRKVFGFGEAVGQSFSYVTAVIKTTISSLGSMLTQGVQNGDVVGFVGIIDLVSQAVRVGFEVVLRFAVLISISLGLMNVLPIPALDGGRFVFLLVEAIIRKPVPAKIEGVIHSIGFILLIALMIFITVSDVSRLFGG